MSDTFDRIESRVDRCAAELRPGHIPRGPATVGGAGLAICSLLLLALLSLGGVGSARAEAGKAHSGETGASLQPEPAATPAPSDLPRALAGLSIPFVPNRGQTDPAVAWYAPTFAGNVFITHEGNLVYDLFGVQGTAGSESGSTASNTGWVLTETPVGGVLGPRAGRPAPTQVSSFVGNDPARWRSGLPTFEVLELGEPWPGIQASIRARGHGVEKVFTLAPGADASRIRMRLSGMGSLSLGEDGALELWEEPGSVRFSPPRAWQVKDGEREPVPVAYAIDGETYGFRLGAHDPARAVVIDPLIQATYLGGSAEDRGHSVAVNPFTSTAHYGEVYVAGFTRSTDFPLGATPGAHTQGNDYDAFVARLSGDLTQLLGATYLGGTGQDYAGAFGGGSALAFHGDSLYLTGYSGSSNLPIPDPQVVQPSPAPGIDAFVAKLSPDLTQLSALTYLGGSGNDDGYGIAGGHPGGGGTTIWIVGSTTSGNLPGSGQSSHGGGNYDAFVARLSDDLRGSVTPLVSSYIGGSSFDKGYGIAYDPVTDQVYVTGEAQSDNLLSSAGGAQPDNGGYIDAFVVRFSADLSELRQTTYLGGTASDQGYGLAIHPVSGDVYLAGYTGSDDLLSPGQAATAAQGSIAGSSDLMLARFDSDLTTLVQATYLGGSDQEFGYNVALSPAADSLYVAGTTRSDRFPGTNGGGQDDLAGDSDAFASRLSSDLGAVYQSTYFGGSSQEQGLGMGLHPGTGDLYLAGLTSSEDLPGTTGGAQEDRNGQLFSSRDAFVARFDAGLGTAPFNVSPGDHDFGVVMAGGQAEQPLVVTIVNTSDAALSLTAIALSDDTNYLLDFDSCGAPPVSLASLESCTVAVRYAPQSAGSHPGLLDVSSAGGHASASLSGRASETSWASHVVDAGVQSVDIVVDASDRVHLCYFAPPGVNGDSLLRYATGRPLAGEAFSAETAAWLNELGSDCAIAAGGGFLHIAYVVEDQLRYARRELEFGMMWEPWTVVASGVTGNCALVVGSDGVPRITYQSYEGDAAAPTSTSTGYAEFLNWEWLLYPISGTDPRAFLWSDVALVPSGLPDADHEWVVANTAAPGGNTSLLGVFDQGSSSWDPQSGTGDLPPVYGLGAPLAASRMTLGEHLVHPFDVAGLDPDSGGLILHNFGIASEALDSRSWAPWAALEFVSEAPDLPNDALHLSLAVPSPAGSTRDLVFYDPRETALVFLQHRNDPLPVDADPLVPGDEQLEPQVTERVDTVGDVGRSAELVHDDSGARHVAYLDATNHTVKYAAQLPPGGAQVRLSPRRWRFEPGDSVWRAFFISAAGGSGEEVVIEDVRIANANVPTDWLLLADCDLLYGDPRGDTLTIGSAGEMRAVCVKQSGDAGEGASRAELVVETSVGDVRAELLRGPPVSDSDGDGASDLAEAGPDGTLPGYDGNADQIADRLQGEVASLPAAAGTSYFTVTASSGALLRDVRMGDNPSPGDTPTEPYFAFGFLGLRVIDVWPVGTVTVDIVLPLGSAVESVYLYGPTPGDPAPHWYEFYYDQTKGAELADNLVRLHFVDGARGDHDLAVNGEILPGRLGLSPPRIPDLVVTDIWDKEGAVCYQVANLGSAAVMEDHTTRLLVDDAIVEGDLITTDLGAGARRSRCFAHDWTCAAPATPAIEVCADGLANVDEGDEGNNCRRETWECDSEAPVITAGPDVSGITQDSATVSWTTDTASDSVVRYGRSAGHFGFDELADSTQTQSHEIQLGNLTASTTYTYVVLSSDKSGNTVESAEGFFRTTEEPGGPTPRITSLTATKGTSELVSYLLEADVEDPEAVERVEFWVDGALLEIVYEAPFEAVFAPAYLGMTHADFFTEHTVTAVAHGGLGALFSEEMQFDPPYECEDIDMALYEPGPSDVLYIDDATVPLGTAVSVSARATIPQERCEVIYGPDSSLPSAPPSRMFFCREVMHRDVSEVNFYVNGALIESQGPSDKGPGRVYTATWRPSGSAPGFYDIRVDAIDTEACKQTVTATYEIRRGTASLGMSRRITRVGNYFEVELNLSNFGHGTVSVDWILDNIDGFQPIHANTPTYSVTSLNCTTDRKGCEVQIDFGAGFYDLPPGALETVNYQMVPAVFPVDDAEELGDIRYAIGAAPVEVRALDHLGNRVWEFEKPGLRTADDVPLSEAVRNAITSSDYLMVANPGTPGLPGGLFAMASGPAELHALHASLAELARYRRGIIGYLSEPGASDPDWIRDQIRIWGSIMQGADGSDEGYLSDGYLLLVGETEVIPSYTKTVRLEEWGTTVHSLRIGFTDLPYADTNGHIDPELSVGRIIGNTISELQTVILNSVNAEKGDPNFVFDRSHALLVAGAGPGVEGYEEAVDEVEEIIDEEFPAVSVLKKRVTEEGGFNINTFFKTIDDRKDVIVYVDHCNPFAWSGVVDLNDWHGLDGPAIDRTTLDLVDFDTAAPFVFAACCQAGQYEDDSDQAADLDNIAEYFLQTGAPAYLGSTENSWSDPNRESLRWFFENWIGTPKPVGPVLRELKVIHSGYWEDMWSYSYNLYGDPKFGGTEPTEAALLELRAAERELVAPPSPYSVVVPDYVVEAASGGDRVRIPGGNLLLMNGKPVVPYYQVTLEYPAGHAVREVALADRSGLETATGLTLPLTNLTRDGDDDDFPVIAPDAEWWPLPERVFEWDFQTLPDDTGRLTLTLYPFYYNSLTTEVEFYRDYIFDIESIVTAVEIAGFTSDRSDYAPGDLVTVNLYPRSSDAAQDLIAEVVVGDESTGEVVGGLGLRTLEGLTGTGAVTLEWDSSGLEPGDYWLEAILRDSEGKVLRTQRRSLTIGAPSLEIENFQVAVAEPFVDVSFGVRNTGATPASGTALTRIYDGDELLVAELDDEFEALQPGQLLDVAHSWDSADAAEGTYRVQSQVLYDSRSTSIEQALVALCPDMDGDAICDAVDVCPEDRDREQGDFDRDTVGDLCDNCPQDPNEDQLDSDHDGIGDICEIPEPGAAALAAAALLSLNALARRRRRG